MSCIWTSPSNYKLNYPVLNFGTKWGTFFLVFNFQNWRTYKNKLISSRLCNVATLATASDFVLRKLVFHFLSNWMGSDRRDSFPLDFEPNGFLFDSKSNGKLLPRLYPIQLERKWNTSFLSVKQYRNTL